MAPSPLDLNAVRAALLHALKTAPNAPVDITDLRCAIAVSGGADSMALTLILADLIGPQNLIALSVDHGLRVEAADEVRQVGEWLEKREIPHVPLKWQGEKPKAGVQEAARHARYHLMEDWCVAHDVPYLMLGHHQGDQAETFMLRLARGSGVAGLSAMRPARPPLTRPDGPWALRPLLNCAPESLRQFLRARDQDWIEDPSNQDMSYDRVRIRHFLSDPPLKGLRVARLAKTAAHLSRANDALAHYVIRLMHRGATFEHTGEALVHWALWQADHKEIILRALSSLCQRVAGRDYAPRFDHIDALYDAFTSGKRVERTLAGCQVIKSTADEVIICRESANITDEITVKTGAHRLIWDGRFQVTGTVSDGTYQLKKLGESGWRALHQDGFMSEVKHVVALSQPALWKGGELIAAPTLGYQRAGKAPQFDAQFIA